MTSYPSSNSHTQNITTTTNRDSVRVVIRLRGGVARTQEVNKDNKLAHTICVTPAVAMTKKTENEENDSSSTLFKEVILDKQYLSNVISSSSTSSSAKERFTFDTVFSSETTQQTMFEQVAEPAVQNSLEGFNCCIMAFGQTSSGKSWTQTGLLDEEDTSNILPETGIIPRVLVSLFDKLSDLPESEVTWSIELSIFELYNEQLYDLLYYPFVASSSSNSSSAEIFNQQQQQSQPELRIREDRGIDGRGVYIEGMTKRQISSPSQALRCIQEASKKKHMAETLMNKNSSRSHTIVQIFITQVNHVQGGTKLSSQFFLVDLAGSERVSRSGAAGTVLKEAQSINLSLTLLGNVINKLTDGKSSHIPYRDSKLTRILSESLGGNATTTLICTSSVLAIDAQESLSTLQFATRAKSIKNAPRANQELTGDALKEAYARAQSEIVSLKEKIRLLQAEVQILSLNHNQSSKKTSTIRPPSTTAATKPSTPANTTSTSSIVGARRTSSSSSSSFIRRNSSSSVSLKKTSQQQQTQLQSPDQVSAFFENIVLEDLQSTVASLITDLNTEKEERQLLVNERDDAVKRAEFHLNREKTLEDKLKEVEKMNSEFSKRIDELEKENEQMKENQRRDPNYERDQLQKRLQEGLRALRAGGGEKRVVSNSEDNNNDQSKSNGSHPILGEVDTSPTPAVASATATSSSLATLAAEEKFKAEISELRHKVAYLSQKLNDDAKSSTHYEKLFETKVDHLEIQHKQELEEVKKEYQRASEMSENELLRLQSKLDVRVAEINKLKEELEESENAKEGLRNQVRRAHDSIQDVLGTEHQNAAVLHMENRKNAERIRELVVKNEKSEQTIKELRGDINQLLKDIENAPISADVKAKLLVRESLQKQKSLFKKKLMECFAYDDGTK